MSSLPAAHFEALYRADPDPWSFASSAYEHAKYDRTIAALGARRYGRALELGCSIGVLTERLAAYCDELVACDAAPSAVAAARRRVAASSGVHVVRAVLPAEQPPGRWDLIVASEVLYYLDAASLTQTLDGLEAALAPGGTVLAVHWLHHAQTHPLGGDEVHTALQARPGLERDHAERHADYRLDRFVRR